MTELCVGCGCMTDGIYFSEEGTGTNKRCVYCERTRLAAQVREMRERSERVDEGWQQRLGEAFAAVEKCKRDRKEELERFAAQARESEQRAVAAAVRAAEERVRRQVQDDLAAGTYTPNGDVTSESPPPAAPYREAPHMAGSYVKAHSTPCGRCGGQGELKEAPGRYCVCGECGGAGNMTHVTVHNWTMRVPNETIGNSLVNAVVRAVETEARRLLELRATTAADVTGTEPCAVGSKGLLHVRYGPDPRDVFMARTMAKLDASLMADCVNAALETMLKAAADACRIAARPEGADAAPYRVAQQRPPAAGRAGRARAGVPQAPPPPHPKEGQVIQVGLRADRYFTCPKGCAHKFMVEHLFDGEAHDAGPWYCDVCGAGWWVRTQPTGTVHVEPTDPDRRMHRERVVLELTANALRAAPLRLVLRGRRFTAQVDEDATRYYYEEHTCPTNILHDVQTVHLGDDADPHGLFALVSVEDDAP